MNKAVPWSIKGVDFDAREAAKEAARRAGMSLGEWMNSVIAERAAQQGVEAEDIDDSGRLEAVTQRLAQMSRGRRDDRDDSDDYLRRRPRARRDRRDFEDQRDFPREARDAPPRDDLEYRRRERESEALLEDAIRAFERGARRGDERTANAISQVARRLEDIESRLEAPRPEVVRAEAVRTDPPRAEPRHDSRDDAIARLEARLEALTKRRDTDATESSLRDLERKLAVMGERAEPRSAEPAREPPPDLARIEAKLNRLLDGVARPPRFDEPPHRAAPVARASLGEAIAQITRRQRALESERPAPALAFAPRAPMQERAPDYATAPQPAAPVAPGPDVAALQRDIAMLATKLDQTRREMLERVAPPRPSEPPRPSAESDHLRRQIDDMSRTLKGLAPRDSIASLENAIVELARRVETSRQVGVHEAVLRPIEDLAADVRQSLAENPPRAGIAGLEREIRAMSQRLDRLAEPAAESEALRDIQTRTQEMRDLLMRAVARPAPTDAVERQIAGLADRVERLAQRGGADAEVATLARGLEEMRRTLESTNSGRFAAQIEAKLEQLGRKIDDAVVQAPAGGQIDELSRRIEEMRLSLARPAGAAGAAPASTLNLEEKVERLARKIDEAVARPAAHADEHFEDLAQRIDEIRHALATRPAGAPVAAISTRHLEDKIETLGRKIEEVAARPPAHAGEQFEHLAERIEEVRQALATRPAGLVAGAPASTRHLEEKIEDLARKIDDAVAQSNAADQFDELAERIDRMQLSLAARAAPPVPAPVPILPPVDTSALERMMRDLATKLERPAAPAGADTRRLEEMVQSLSERLEIVGASGSDLRLVESLQTQIARLADRIDAADATRNDGEAIERLHDEIARFASRLDQGQAGVDLGSIAQLQRQMSQIAERLDQGDESARVLASLETSVGELFQRLDDSRAVALEAAEAAARAAARDTLSEAMQRMPAGAGGAPDPAITRELADLRALQETADRRTHATLSAVHETLEKVVDRLAVLEDDLSEVRLEPLASGPAPTFAKPASQSPAPAPVAPGPAPAAPAARAAAPAEPPRKATPPAAEAEKRQPAPFSANPSIAMDAPLDELIEPGAAAPNGRRAPTPHESRAASGPTQSEVSAQSSFIAAARRAAQAAAGEQPERAGKPRANPLADVLNAGRDRARAAHMALAGKSAGADAPAQPAPGPAAPEAEPAEGYEGAAPARRSGGALGKVRGFVNARKRLVMAAIIGLVAIAGGLQAMRFMGPRKAEVINLTSTEFTTNTTGRQAREAIPRLPPPGSSEPRFTGGSQGFSRAPADIAAASRFTPPGGAARNGTDPAPTGSIAPRAPMGAPSINDTPAGAKSTSLHDAASAGDAAAQFELGVRYAEGRTVARDAKLAAEWLEKAARQNLAPAQYRLGSQYERGVGVDRDAKRAREWYQRAAEAGNVRAMHNLAVLAAEGVEGKPDYATAASWFRKASDHGVRDSQYNLGILYARGLGVEQNLQQSWVLFSLAAAQGDEDAGKKREDVANRIDAKGLAVAKASLEAFKPRPADKAANEVATPSGGWDVAGQPGPQSQVKPSTTVAPSAKPAPKGKVTSL